MSSMYHQGHRQLQDQFDTRRLADKMQEKIVHDTINPRQKAFIESVDMFFLATADEQGHPSCSYRGGEPGFVRVIDEKTLALPNYDGDGMYISWGNVMRNPHVALLFLDFMKGWRLRIHGTATVSMDDPLMGEFPGAQFVVTVIANQVFPNCPRYIHKYQLVERSVYVPRDGCVAPVPDWKRQPDFNQALPKNDPARTTQQP